MDKQEALSEMCWLGIYISDAAYKDALISLDELKKYILKEREKK